MNLLHTAAYVAGITVRFVWDKFGNICDFALGLVLSSTDMMKPDSVDFLPWNQDDSCKIMTKAEWDIMVRTRSKKAAKRSAHQAAFSRQLKGK